MRTSRLLTGVVAAGLLGFAPMTLSAPANAAIGTYNTAITLDAPYDTMPVESGEVVTFTGGTKGVDPATGQANMTVMAGTVTLLELTSKNPTWVPIATDSDGAGYFSFDVKVKTNSQYKAVYSGGNWAPSSYTNETYLASESLPVNAPVIYKMTVKSKPGYRVSVNVKVSPDYKRKKLAVYTKFSKKASWKLYRKFTTSSKGVAKFKLPRAGRTMYVRMKASGTKHYNTTVFDGTVS